MKKNTWKQKITVHCVIKNEERWIWYAINSVIDWVDKILIFDTGSTDNTVRIIKSIKSPKIVFKEKGEVDPKEFAQLRQEMLNRTKNGWVFILDGDEIWTQQAMEEIRKIIENRSQIEALCARYWHCSGDIFHYDAELEEKIFRIGSRSFKGWRSTRCFRRDIPGLHVTGVYGFEGYADKNGKQIHDLDKNNVDFLTNRLFHTSFLKRSTKDKLVMQRSRKRRYSLGQPLPKKTIFPLVFELDRPSFVLSPYESLSFSEKLLGFFYEPVVKIRTAIWKVLVYPKIKRAQKDGINDDELAKMLKLTR